MSLELQVIGANATFTSQVTGLGACTFWRTDKRYRAILTRAASKFPPKIVVPFGGCARSGIRRDARWFGQDSHNYRQRPRAAESFAEASSNE